MNWFKEVISLLSATKYVAALPQCSWCLRFPLATIFLLVPAYCIAAGHVHSTGDDDKFVTFWTFDLSSRSKTTSVFKTVPVVIPLYYLNSSRQMSSNGYLSF